MSRSIARKPAPGLSRQTLEQTPVRALSFLRAVGTNADIHSALANAGFTKKDLEQGWALLRGASTSTTNVVTVRQNPVLDALQQLEAWSGPGFLRARAALRRLHPDQEAFVFHNLDARRGPETVLMVGAFLDRCDLLESSPARKATREEDLGAVATLEKRGITRSERARLRGLVNVIECQTAPLPDEVIPPAAVRDVPVAELHAWLQDWSETARAVIKRRDHLIRLGIGKRRARKAAVGGVPSTSVAPAPVLP